MKGYRVRGWVLGLSTCVAAAFAGRSAMAGEPGDDDCSSPRTLDCNDTLTQDTRNATSDPNDPLQSCTAAGPARNSRSVWYQLSACSTSVALETCGSSYDTVLSVYTGACGSLTEIACNDDNGSPNCSTTLQSGVSFSSVPGTIFLIEVTAFGNGAGGDLVLHSTCTAVVNDCCETPTSVTCNDMATTVAEDTRTATQAASDPVQLPCSGFQESRSVWFSFTPRCERTATIDTIGSNYDTVLSVWTGTCGALTSVACNDDIDAGGGNVQSSVTFTTVGGTTYLIEVTDFDDAGDGDTGDTGGDLVLHLLCADNVPPRITCPDDITTECTGPSGAAVSFTVVAMDACGISTFECIPPTGSVFPTLGSIGTTVTCTVTDGGGNTAQCSFRVFVVDTTTPLIQCSPNLTVECTGATGANVSFTTTATDLCDASPTVNCTPVSGALFPIGQTTVNCTAVDDDDNSARCAFTVTVRDTVAPLIQCPDDIEQICSGDPEGTEVDFRVTATDVCDSSPLVNCNPPSGHHFQLGETHVHCTATDDAGNVGRCHFEVRILPSTSSDLPTTVIGQPASALIFPLFDSTARHGTILTVTNTHTDRHACGNGFRPGDVKLLYTYFGFDPGREFCREFNTEHFLTPGDTLTVLADQDNPEGVLGWLWVEARDPETGAPIQFDHLIGSAIVVDTGLDFLDQYLAYGFRSYAMNQPEWSEDGCGRALSDVNGNGFADFDGVEYDFWPQRLFLDNFFQQGDGTQGFANELTLASCDVNPFDGSRTTVVAHPWNNRERRFSATFDFECFFHAPLAPAISGVFRGLGGDPNELVFAGHHLQTGWLELDASDPILGVIFQRVVGTGFAAGHQLQFAGQFGGPCDENRNHEPCALPRVD